MKDYTNARYYAISGLGYGKGFTPQEAVENYVRSQLRNVAAKNTVYETRPRFEAALRSGDLEPDVWLAPEGAIGFVTDGSLHWAFREGQYQAATPDQLVRRALRNLSSAEATT